METKISMRLLSLKSIVITLLAFGCSDQEILPEPSLNSYQVTAQGIGQATPWGPETPNFNLEAILRSDGSGFGLVKFRQPNDDQKIIYLDTSVRGLEPNTSYSLQRAVDTNLDGNCTSTMWLTLGEGLVAKAIMTDDTGKGSALLFRDLASLAIGATFDIHFQVIKTTTGEVVLSSDCYEYTISQ